MKKQNNIGVSIARPLRKNQRGITLIALVITIIVLLILAGITINLTIGQDGILKRAQEAGKNYTNAAEYEQTQLAEFTNQVDNIINGLGGNNGPEPKYTMVDGVPVPKGFTHTEGTKATGFVIKDTSTNADGTPTATNGNEYVWVPVDDTTSYSYERVAWVGNGLNCVNAGTENSTNSIMIKYNSSDSYYFKEAMPNIAENYTELQSANQYKGYYIGRYEVGIIGYDTPISTNRDGTTTWTGYSNGTAVVQQGKQVWNWITRDKAKEVAESMYSDNDAVISRLCSSYAWDTALKFIETNYLAYPTNSSVQGNYSDKADTLGKPALTGQTTAVNNIYDMGGNVSDWTTEYYVSYDGGGTCVLRGGNYYGEGTANSAAAGRGRTTTTTALANMGFRTTLYL